MILREAVNSSEECFEGSITPIPPNLTGRAKRSYSASLWGGGGGGGGMGINFCSDDDFQRS